MAVFVAFPPNLHIQFLRIGILPAFRYHIREREAISMKKTILFAAAPAVRMLGRKVCGNLAEYADRAGDK